MAHPTDTKPALNLAPPSRPLIDYKGKIVYRNNMIEIAIICEELL